VSAILQYYFRAGNGSICITPFTTNLKLLNSTRHDDAKCRKSIISESLPPWTPTKRKQRLKITHQQIQRVPNYTGNGTMHGACEMCDHREKTPRLVSIAFLILLFTLHSSLRCHEKRDRHYSLAPCRFHQCMHSPFCMRVAREHAQPKLLSWARPSLDCVQ